MIVLGRRHSCTHCCELVADTVYSKQVLPGIVVAENSDTVASFEEDTL